MRQLKAGIQPRMSLPTNPVDKHLPKGANFLAVVVGFAVAILLVLLVVWLVIGRRGKKIYPVDTKTIPSQTLLGSPQDVPRSVVQSWVALQIPA